MSFSLIYEPESNILLLFNVSSDFRILEWYSLTTAFNYPVEDTASRMCARIRPRDQIIKTKKQLKSYSIEEGSDETKFAYRRQKSISYLAQNNDNFSDTRVAITKYGQTRRRAPRRDSFVPRILRLLFGLVDDFAAWSRRKSRLTWRRRFHFRRASSTYVGSLSSRDTLRRPLRQRTHRARSVVWAAAVRLSCRLSAPALQRPTGLNLTLRTTTRRCWSTMCKADPRETIYRWIMHVLARAPPSLPFVA